MKRPDRWPRLRWRSLILHGGGRGFAVPAAWLSAAGAPARRATATGAVLIGLAVFATAARAAVGNDLAALCDAAAARAAAQSGVPLSVLRAISLTETGRKRDGAFRPWPWTVNMEGKGVWFDTEDEARAYVDKNFQRGARSFDIGCFQINYRWHGQAFSSIDQMFDPQANALYAAKFLRELYDEFGDWGQAAGAYHSRTPEFANRYRARFERIRSRFSGSDDIPVRVAALSETTRALQSPGSMLKPPPAALRVNQYPLLQATGAAPAMGSLVPLGRAGPVRRFIAAPEDRS